MLTPIFDVLQPFIYAGAATTELSQIPRVSTVRRLGSDGYDISTLSESRIPYRSPLAQSALEAVDELDRGSHNRPISPGMW